MLSRFRYTGQAALPELALYHYKARAYDPRLGRFLQNDPIGYEDDLWTVSRWRAPRPVSTPPQSAYLGAMYDLYHPRIFELAAEIPHIGRLPAPQGSAMRHSRICGSTVTVDVRMDASVIGAFALEVEACALGQASAAVLARAAIGATRAEIAQALDALEAMLKQDGAPPSGRFWELRHLEGVREYPARHVSVMLPWRAALAAIDAANPDQAGATAARTSA
jgi:RHS repeat-associated protein